MRLIALPTIAALLAGIVPAAAAAQEKVNLNVSTTERRGICFIAFPRPGRTENDPKLMLEFSVRAKDGNFGTSLGASSWSIIEGKDLDKKALMTLKFKGGKSTTSITGGYKNGMEQGFWAGWGAGPNSDAALKMLDGAGEVSVSFDGEDFGKFDLQMPRFAHTWLTDCVARTNAAAASQ